LREMDTDGTVLKNTPDELLNKAQVLTLGNYGVNPASENNIHFYHIIPYNTS